MAAPVVEISDSEIKDFLNLISGPEREQETLANLSLPTAELACLAATQDPPDWQLVSDLGPGLDLGNDEFGFLTIDPRPLDPTGPPSESIQVLDDGANWRRPSKQTDRLVKQQPIRFRIEKLTEEDVLKTNQNAPDPQSHIQTPEFLEYFTADGELTYAFEREAHARDWARLAFSPAPNLESLVVRSIRLADKLADRYPIGPQPARSAGTADIKVVDLPRGSNANASSSSAAPNTQDPPQGIRPRHPCAECIFAKKTAECDGSPCVRCMGLVRKENARVGEVQRWNGEQTPTLDYLIFFDIATTTRARMISGELLVLPALSEEQLNLFTDAQAPRAQILALSDNDQAIITTAWRCAYYLGLLYNWNAHRIHYEQYTPLRGVNLPMSKNLILEIMYAIAFRIQELAMMLLRLVHEALYAKPYGSPRDYDSATILCALWIVYSSGKKFKKLKQDWEFAGIVKLVRNSSW
ncbi:hypothetical protein B0H67DRAFT_554571 [Lasiosphaeris hirsuta]|uniref:Uncharacterized protein n=1 Tax=Lasiosphaeris hirsuta TaxID=260670 RepID=A0AA40AI29_9PEZI|nr:hypothetical protein B0H67DRAFT_554571 [Lasiosphaeris hirsuta]